MNPYSMFFVQTSTWPPNMHLKLTKHGRFYKQNNKLPTKGHDEVKDNSNVEAWSEFMDDEIMERRDVLQPWLCMANYPVKIVGCEWQIVSRRSDYKTELMCKN